ncbi:MAG: hypothetical protein OSJ52_08130, partial [Lachnospiraceae bacterium]|nr:hypothetical protein [Lachnospiraceae bacterium]
KEMIVPRAVEIVRTEIVPKVEIGVPRAVEIAGMIVRMAMIAPMAATAPMAAWDVAETVAEEICLFRLHQRRYGRGRIQEKEEGSKPEGRVYQTRTSHQARRAGRWDQNHYSAGFHDVKRAG